MKGDFEEFKRLLARNLEEIKAGKRESNNLVSRDILMLDLDERELRDGQELIIKAIHEAMG